MVRQVSVGGDERLTAAASVRRNPPDASPSSGPSGAAPHSSSVGANGSPTAQANSQSVVSSITFGENNTSLRSRSRSPLSIPFLPDHPPTALRKSRATQPTRSSTDDSHSRTRDQSAHDIANRIQGRWGSDHHYDDRTKNSDKKYYSDWSIDNPAEKGSMVVESKHIEMGSMRDKFHKTTSESKIKRDGPTMIKRVGDWGHGRWIGYCFWLILALIIQFSIGIKGSWAFPDGRGPACIPNVEMDSGGDDAGAADGNGIKNKSICLLMETLADGAGSLRILSAFILGGFLVGSVQLWLARRTAYTALCGATRNLLINVCSIVPEPTDKELFARWSILGFELAVLKGRGLIDSEEGRAYLHKLNLIEEDEWSSMVDGDRHTTVWFWIQVKAEKLMRKNEIQGLEFQTICRAVTLSRDRANDLMSCINLDQPPPYIFVCGLLININLLLLSLTTGIKWAIWMYDTEGSIWKEPRMYAEVLILFFNTSIYAMLFDLCTLLYNPFGPRKIDIIHHEVGGGIRRLAKNLSKTNFPSTMGEEPGKRRNSTKRNEVCFADQIEDERSNMEAEVQLMNRAHQTMVKPMQISIPMGFSILSGKGRQDFMHQSHSDF